MPNWKKRAKTQPFPLSGSLVVDFCFWKLPFLQPFHQKKNNNKWDYLVFCGHFPRKKQLEWPQTFWLKTGWSLVDSDRRSRSFTGRVESHGSCQGSPGGGWWNPVAGYALVKQKMWKRCTLYISKIFQNVCSFKMLVFFLFPKFVAVFWKPFQLLQDFWGYFQRIAVSSHSWKVGYEAQHLRLMKYDTIRARKVRQLQLQSSSLCRYFAHSWNQGLSFFSAKLCQFPNIRYTQVNEWPRFSNAFLTHSLMDIDKSDTMMWPSVTCFF